MNEREGAIAALGRIQGLGVLALVIGVIGSVATFAIDKGQNVFWPCYLFAFIFWIGLTLGCFGMSMLHHMIRGRYTMPVLRIFEAGSVNLWLMLILFVPIVLVMLNHQLFPWAFTPDNPILAGNRELRDAIHWKQEYLNPPFFIVRAAIYFIIWLALATVLNRSSWKQDETGNPSLTESRASIASPGIVIYILTVTFACTDWVMSLDPRWFSTIYGFWFVVGQGLSATSFTIMVYAFLGRHRPFSDTITPGNLRDLGNVLLTFTMFWGYFTLSQWLIIYSGNLPDEVSYYLQRGLQPSSPAWAGVWWFMGTAIVLGQFFIPFLCLLSGRAKKTAHLIALVALLVFIIRILDIFWVTLPFFHPQDQPQPALLILGGPAVWLAMGGLWLLLFARNMRSHPLMARHGAVVTEALEHA